MPLVACPIPSFQRLSPMTRPWPGGATRAAERASTRNGAALGALLLPCAATWCSRSAREGLLGATHRGQPWTPAVTRPYGCDGQSVGLSAVGGTFRRPSLGRRMPHQGRRHAFARWSHGRTRHCWPAKTWRRDLQAASARCFSPPSPALRFRPDSQDEPSDVLPRSYWSGAHRNTPCAHRHGGRTRRCP